MSIKAIETVYNGRRFRSRLEAKWSLFLDTLGVKYRYEPEGYNLNGEVNYLPDFFIDDWQCWLEVKGPEPTEEEQRKAYLLSRESGYPVIIAYGSFTLSDGHLCEPLLRVFYGTAKQLFERNTHDSAFLLGGEKDASRPLKVFESGRSVPVQMLEWTMIIGSLEIPYSHTLEFYRYFWQHAVDHYKLGEHLEKFGWVNGWPGYGDDHCLRAIMHNEFGSWPILIEQWRVPLTKPLQPVPNAAKAVMQHRFVNFNNN